MHRPLDNLRVLRPTRQGRVTHTLCGTILLALPACAPGADAPPAEDPAADVGQMTPAPPAAPSPAAGTERPETMRGALLIEGMEDSTTFRLYRAPEGFALPFSTYLPQDVLGEAVRFVANFGGERRERIYLHLAVPAEPMTAEQVEERVREVAESLGTAERVAEPAHPWALAEYTARGSDTAARVMLGRHGGRYFYLISHAPLEALDGWGPREAAILRAWRWADGSAL